MSSRLRQRLPGSIAIVVFVFASVIASYAESINYGYDDMNRLTRVVYGTGFIVYKYDEVGNRLEQKIQPPETTPPTTTASPAGGTYTSAQLVTLGCYDGEDSAGCDKIYFTTDGSTPTTSSMVYTVPISLLTPTTLKFFSRDLAGNSESVKTLTYIIPIPPYATTNVATVVPGYSATLNGTVIPNGLSTNYHFEWGLTTSYGNSTTAQSAGNGIGDVPVSAHITHLARNTIYHYRLVATNSLGTAYGLDTFFKTKPLVLPFLILLLSE